MVKQSVFVTHPIGVLSLNDGAKIRHFFDSIKFRVAIRADFLQLSNCKFVNNPNL